MAKLAWDQVGERLYETGVDRGVLYLPGPDGKYTRGVAWNGLTAVTQSPSGAEPTPLYADNIKYLELRSAEEFGATIEAYTYPDEFAQCDGTAEPVPGMTIGQQTRKPFGLSHRTIVGNDVDNNDHGYKLHMIYGATAAPSERAYATVNDSPEAITLSWELSTTPVEVGEGFKPAAIITVDSTKMDPTKLAELEAILYGTEEAEARLPLPSELLALLGGTEVSPEAPTQQGNEVTIPTTPGVVYKNGATTVTGALTITEDTTIVATPASGYRFPNGVTGQWLFEFQA